MGFIIFVIAIALIVFATYSALFTARMFAEAVSEPDPDERTNWVFTVKFFGPIGALMYYFERHRSSKR